MPEAGETDMLRKLMTMFTKKEETSDDPLARLRTLGAIIGERRDGENLRVVTRGGHRFTLPRDTEVVAGMSDRELLGLPATDPAAVGGLLQPRTVKDLEAMGVVA